MATTNLIPVHTGKNGSIIKTLRRVIANTVNQNYKEQKIGQFSQMEEEELPF